MVGKRKVCCDSVEQRVPRSLWGLQGVSSWKDDRRLPGFRELWVDSVSTKCLSSCTLGIAVAIMGDAVCGCEPVVMISAVSWLEVLELGIGGRVFIYREMADALKGAG